MLALIECLTEFRSPPPPAEAYLTPEAAAMVQLYAALLNDYLSEVGWIGFWCLHVRLFNAMAGLKSPA